MGVLLIIIAVILASAVVNDNVGDLGKLVKGDMLGTGSKAGFIEWVAAILIIGSLLKMLNLPEAGKAIIILVIIAFLLGNTQIPQQLLQAIQGVGGAPNPAPTGVSGMAGTSPKNAVTDLSTLPGAQDAIRRALQ